MPRHASAYLTTLALPPLRYAVATPRTLLPVTETAVRQCAGAAAQTFRLVLSNGAEVTRPRVPARLRSIHTRCTGAV